MSQPTKMHILLDALWAERYGQPLGDWVADRRDRDKPITWRHIAREISDLTGADINHATLMTWFPELKGDGDRAAA